MATLSEAGFSIHQVTLVNNWSDTNVRSLVRVEEVFSACVGVSPHATLPVVLESKPEYLDPKVKGMMIHMPHDVDYFECLHSIATPALLLVQSPLSSYRYLLASIKIVRVTKDFTDWQGAHLDCTVLGLRTLKQVNLWLFSLIPRNCISAITSTGSLMRLSNQPQNNFVVRIKCSDTIWANIAGVGILSAGVYSSEEIAAHVNSLVSAVTRLVKDPDTSVHRYAAYLVGMSVGGNFAVRSLRPKLGSGYNPVTLAGPPRVRTEAASTLLNVLGRGFLIQSISYVWYIDVYKSLSHFMDLRAKEIVQNCFVDRFYTAMVDYGGTKMSESDFVNALMQEEVQTYRGWRVNASTSPAHKIGHIADCIRHVITSVKDITIEFSEFTSENYAKWLYALNGVFANVEVSPRSPANYFVGNTRINALDVQGARAKYGALQWIALNKQHPQEFLHNLGNYTDFIQAAAIYKNVRLVFSRECLSRGRQTVMISSECTKQHSANIVLFRELEDFTRATLEISVSGGWKQITRTGAKATVSGLVGAKATKKKDADDS